EERREGCARHQDRSREDRKYRQAQNAAVAREEEPRGGTARRGARSRVVGERHPQAAKERFAAVAHARQADQVARAPRCTDTSAPGHSPGAGVLAWNSRLPTCAIASLPS